MMRPHRENKPIPPDILAKMKKASEYVRQRGLRERQRCISYDDKCSECGDEIAITDYQRSCQDCGLIEPNYQAVEFVGNHCYKTPKYKLQSHFENVLDRLQGGNTCERIDEVYIEQLKTKLEVSPYYSLEDIHKNLPNKDQRYLNYIHSKLTGRKLWIENHHMDCLSHWYGRCYEKIPSGKRPCVLNIIGVVVDCHPALSYIKPFIYTKFKLDDDIYTQLKDVCTRQDNR